MSFEGKIKGIHLINVFNYIKHKRGVLGITELLKQINEGASGPDLIDENSFVEKHWYPYEFYLRFLKLADKITGNGDLSKCFDIGYQTVQNLGHLSYMTRAPDIFEFISTGEKGWNKVYDFGKPESIKISHNKMKFRYHGFPKDKAKNEYFRGSLTGMLELCKLEKVSVELVKDNESEDDYSEYELSWE